MNYDWRGKDWKKIGPTMNDARTIIHHLRRTLNGWNIESLEHYGQKLFDDVLNVVDRADAGALTDPVVDEIQSMIARHPNMTAAARELLHDAMDAQKKGE